MTPIRILCILTVGLALAALGAPSLSGGRDAAPPVVARLAPPVALISISELFGDENEADENENESDEGGGGAGAREYDSGVSFPLMLLLAVALVLAVVGAGALVLRRIRARLRRISWLRRV